MIVHSGIQNDIEKPHNPVLFAGGSGYSSAENNEEIYRNLTDYAVVWLDMVLILFVTIISNRILEVYRVQS